MVSVSYDLPYSPVSTETIRCLHKVLNATIVPINVYIAAGYCYNCINHAYFVLTVILCITNILTLLNILELSASVCYQEDNSSFASVPGVCTVSLTSGH